MTNEVMAFVKETVEKFAIKGKILDCGSRDVNGCVKPIFEGCEYTGLDMEDGPNVDITAKADCIPFDDYTFDCVVSVEMLEHDDNPFESVKEMYRVLKPGGYIILTARGIGCGKHDYPGDYFRYTAAGLAALMRGFEDIFSKEDEIDTTGTFGYGKKPGEGGI